MKCLLIKSGFCSGQIASLSSLGCNGLFARNKGEAE